ncbi:ricin-type beta-trefoil lectin domain protein [Alkalinema sp. FACHB-956]|uniref:ricin-type beta-trefoil lectin domain protein n=1 Tax=Alkalinema sp. FACHB-956 TaxID=2692768 RepID=UPI0016837740|nr:ricin-type beta-trefoil lectin domain protein [Alkalinema sp. FACHB-956]MBD2329174.1 ricin-type beta-trefoil lectin domain protein [Alkalinema sp. FACHB-956]
MLKSRTKTFAFAIIPALLSATAVAGQAQAETLSIGGKALNTNRAFSRIDGQPRVTIWDRVSGDPDQDFQRLQGNRGGVLLKNRTTGNCINAYRKFNGAEFNTWPCNPNDPDQNWQINSLGSNLVQLKLVGTNLCIDTPTRTNGGKVHLWGCDANNPNQRWLSSNGTINSPSTQKAEEFFRWANGQYAISRLDNLGWDSRGQCVTLVVRYLQEVFFNRSTATRAYGHGRDVAGGVARQHSNLFEPLTNQGLPKRGAIISFTSTGDFTQYGHVGIVMESRSFNGQRQIKLMDSNANGGAPNTSVRTTDWINMDSYSGRVVGWTNPR